jgi:3-oxoacyl-[acyl-carrier-protein] synthase III
MKCTSTYLRTAAYALRDPQPPAHSTSVVSGCASPATADAWPTTIDLAVEAANAAIANAAVTATTLTGIYYVTDVLADNVDRSLATEMAFKLPLDTTRLPVDLVPSDRLAVIKTIFAAARDLAGARGDDAAVLITAGDAPDPHAAADKPTAGGALVMSRDDGELRLVSTVVRNDPELQRLRDQQADPKQIRDRAVDLVTDAISEALAEAHPHGKLKAADIAHMITPATSDPIEAEAFVDRLGGSPFAFWTVNREEGPSEHFGTADIFVRLGTVDGISELINHGEWVLLAATANASAAVALLRAL